MLIYGLFLSLCYRVIIKSELYKKVHPCFVLCYFISDPGLQGMDDRKYTFFKILYHNNTKVNEIQITDVEYDGNIFSFNTSTGANANFYGYFVEGPLLPSFLLQFFF